MQRAWPSGSELEGEAAGEAGAGPQGSWVTCPEGTSLSSTGTKLWGLADGMEDRIEGDTVEQMDQRN